MCAGTCFHVVYIQHAALKRLIKNMNKKNLTKIQRV